LTVSGSAGYNKIEVVLYSQKGSNQNSYKAKVLNHIEGSFHMVLIVVMEVNNKYGKTKPIHKEERARQEGKQNTFE
jgi:hypothetical protein